MSNCLLRKSLLAAGVALATLVSGFGHPPARASTAMLGASVGADLGAFAMMTPSGPPAKPQSMVIPTTPIVDAASVGYLPGASAVTPSGQYSYTIPLEVPPGRSGMQPSLSLNYDSGGGNGLLGVGWTLSVGSSITRCGHTFASDGQTRGVHYTDYSNATPAGKRDRLCLDGNKLVLVSGYYGQNGSVYRTERDTQVRVVASGAGSTPDSFVVTNANGLKRTYDARKSKRYSSTVAGFGTATEVTDYWALTEETALDGNGISYNYTTVDGSTLGIQHLLDSIIYTNHSDLGYGWFGNAAHRMVKFNYEERLDKEFGWTSGVPWRMHRRLKSISMYAPNPTSVSEIRNYKLSYISSTHTQRSLLKSVQLCGPDDGRTQQCTWTKEFEWPATQGSGIAFTEHANVHTTALARTPVTARGLNDFMWTPIEGLYFNGWGQNDEGRGWMRMGHSARGGVNAAGVNFRVFNVADDGSRDAIALAPGGEYYPASGSLEWDAPYSKKLLIPTPAGQSFWAKPWSVWANMADYVPDAWDSGEFMGRYQDWLMNYVPVDFDSDGVDEMYSPAHNTPYPNIFCLNKFRQWDGATFSPLSYQMDEKSVCFSHYPNFASAEEYPNSANDLPSSNRFMDIDGDGRQDRIGAQAEAWPQNGSPPGAVGQMGAWRYALRNDIGFASLSPRPNEPANGLSEGVSASCPSYAVDFTGDGKAQLFGQVHEHSTLKQFTQANLNTVSCLAPALAFHDGTEWSLEIDSTGKWPRAAQGKAWPTDFHADNGGIAKFEEPNLLRNAEQQLHFGDYNGDGLVDVIEPIDGALVLRWNTGNGFGPPTAPIADMNWTAGTQDWGYYEEYLSGTEVQTTWPKRNRKKNYLVLPHDVNRDGRSDLVVFYSEASSWYTQPTTQFTKVFLSRGDGTFSTITVDGDTAALVAQLGGGMLAGIGDFNGDGYADIARLRGIGAVDPQYDTITQGNVDILLQTPTFADRVIEVKDGGAATGHQKIAYSTEWSDASSQKAEYTCSYPLRCIRRGLIVVRTVTRIGDVADASPPSQHAVYYSYDDPVEDMKGRGFLGFTYVRSWDPLIPTETVTVYDNRTRKEGQNANGVKYYYYPFVGMPSYVQTVTPIMPASDVSRRPSGGNARVSTVNYTPEFQPLPGDANTAQLPRYATYAKESLTKTWEEPVTIDWNLPLLGEPELPAPTRAHIRDINFSGTPQRVWTTRINDSYGNADKTDIVTDYGVTTGSKVVIEADYEYRTSAGQWLLGLPMWQKTTTTKYQNPGPQPTLSSRVDYHFNDLGQLDTLWVEKDNPDIKLRSSASLTYDALGHVVTTSVSARAKESDAVDSVRISHVEYGQIYPGAPDERIFPSQTWAEHNSPDCDALGKDCRPSMWLAMHPAYAVPVSSMDVNGVRSWASYDRFGRPVSAESDGQPSVSMSYAERWDQAGGIKGMKVTSQVENRLTSVASDALGRPIWATTRGFDGAEIIKKTTYNALGRMTASSRPYFVTGGSPQWVIPTYDSLGRVTKVSKPDNSFTLSGFTGLFEASHTDEEGETSTQQVDIDGQLVSSISSTIQCPPPDLPGPCAPGQIGTTYKYGGFGLLQKVLNPQGKTSKTTTYDTLGRPIGETELDAGTTSLTYNGFGEIVSTTRAEVGTSSASFDDLGRPLSSTSPDGTTTTTWDTAANGIGLPAVSTSAMQQDERQFKHIYSYDALSRPIATRLQFWKSGIVTGNYELSTSFDSQGRAATLSYPDVPGRQRLVVKHDYNSYGYLTKVTDITAGQSTKVLSEVTQRNADLALTQGFLGAGAIGVQRQYEALNGRLKQLKYSYAGAGAGTNLLIVDYAYWLDGLVKSRATDDAEKYRIETFDFDSLKRLTYWGLIHQTTGGISVAQTAPATTYMYDAVGNLTGIWKDSTQVEQRSYGKAGGVQPHTLTNIWNKVANTNTAYQYDAAGRMFQDPKRNLTYNAFDLPKSLVQEGQSWKFWYDANGQRALKTGPDGSTLYVGAVFERRQPSGGGVTDVFHVDGVDGTRAQINFVEGAGPNVVTNKVFTNDTDYTLPNSATVIAPLAVDDVPASGATTSVHVLTHFANTVPGNFNIKLKRPDGNVHVLHTGVPDASANPANFNGNYTVSLPANFAPNGNWDLIVEGKQGNTGVLQSWVLNFTIGTLNPNVVYPLTDALDSTGVVVNQFGAILERNYYDPFGQRVLANGSVQASVPNKLVKHGFTGQEHEDSFGLINFKGRMYDPTMKRFLTPDPIVSAPGFSQSWNPYSYVMNSPLNLVDPTGYQSVPCTSTATTSAGSDTGPSGLSCGAGSGTGGADNSGGAGGAGKSNYSKNPGPRDERNLGRSGTYNSSTWGQGSMPSGATDSSVANRPQSQSGKQLSRPWGQVDGDLRVPGWGPYDNSITGPARHEDHVTDGNGNAWSYVGRSFRDPAKDMYASDRPITGCAGADMATICYDDAYTPHSILSLVGDLISLSLPGGTPEKTASGRTTSTSSGTIIDLSVSNHTGDPSLIPNDLPGWHTAAAHGGIDFVEVAHGGTTIEMNHIQFGNYLKYRGWNGTDPVRLLACDTGACTNGGFAAEFSKYWNVDVIAPNGAVTVDEFGKVLNIGTYITPTKGGQTFRFGGGAMRRFSPGKKPFVIQ